LGLYFPYTEGLNNKYLTPDFGGQFNPATYGQDRWLFYQLRELIYNVLIVQHRNLMIFHEKNNGILRQPIRQYIAKVDVVKSSRDEHIEFGC
jgi:hypothetical protein